MGVPISQMWTVSTYVLKQRLFGRKRYPLVLMLEPLFRCNLACAGCGKIQHPVEVLRDHLTPEQCFDAVDQCGSPIVSIPGGEPLLHPQIAEIVQGLAERKKYIYLCTNGLLLEKNLHLFEPSKYLSLSVHIDGLEAEHDAAVCREGVYEKAIRAIRLAIQKGFRVTTNSTFFQNADPQRTRELFDELTKIGVEGMMLSPGYEYEKAPEQNQFLPRQETISLFQKIFSVTKPGWIFNQSPLFLEFLKGRWDLQCTPWGNPTYNLFGWQKPCYLLEEGYAESFEELMTQTEWSRYGSQSSNPKCANCMVHSGFEATAVEQTFGTWKGFCKTVSLVLFGASKTTPAQSPALMSLEISQKNKSVENPGIAEELVELTIEK